MVRPSHRKPSPGECASRADPKAKFSSDPDLDTGRARVIVRIGDAPPVPGRGRCSHRHEESRGGKGGGCPDQGGSHETVPDSVSPRQFPRSPSIFESIRMVAARSGPMFPEAPRRCASGEPASPTPSHRCCPRSSSAGSLAAYRSRRTIGRRRSGRGLGASLDLGRPRRH